MNIKYTTTRYLICPARGLGSCRTWAIVCLTVAFAGQRYTLRLLVNLHEPVAGGTRYSRYMHLATTVFGRSPIPARAYLRLNY